MLGTNHRSSSILPVQQKSENAPDKNFLMNLNHLQLYKILQAAKQQANAGTLNKH
jgi:hypothetical protein